MMIKEIKPGGASAVTPPVTPPGAVPPVKPDGQTPPAVAGKVIPPCKPNSPKRTRRLTRRSPARTGWLPGRRS